LRSQARAENGKPFLHEALQRPPVGGSLQNRGGSVRPVCLAQPRVNRADRRLRKHPQPAPAAGFGAAARQPRRSTLGRGRRASSTQIDARAWALEGVRVLLCGVPGERARRHRVSLPRKRKLQHHPCSPPRRGELQLAAVVGGDPGGYRKPPSAQPPAAECPAQAPSAEAMSPPLSEVLPPLLIRRDGMRLPTLAPPPDHLPGEGGEARSLVADLDARPPPDDPPLDFDRPPAVLDRVRDQVAGELSQPHPVAPNPGGIATPAHEQGSSALLGAGLPGSARVGDQPRQVDLLPPLDSGTLNAGSAVLPAAVKGPSSN